MPSVRRRAALVRAAPAPAGRAGRVRRPAALTLGGGGIAVVGWLLMAIVIGDAIINGSSSLDVGLIAPVAIAAYLGGIVTFSWGWELGQPGRALVMAVALALIGVVLWAVIAVIAAILVAASKASDESSSEDGGSSGPAAGPGNSSGSTIAIIDQFVTGIGELIEDLGGDADPAPGDDAPPQRQSAS